MIDAQLLGIALFALAAGAAAFFAPCSYALLPGYVGYYVAATGRDAPPLSGTIARGGSAAIGSLLVFGVLSGVAIVAGSALERALPFLEYGVGIALVVLGSWVLYGGAGAIHVVLPERRSSVIGFGLFGAAYAAASTACVLPLFLAFVFRSLTLAPAETALVLGAYAGGFAALLLSVTVAIAVGHSLGARRLARYNELFVRIAGLLLVLAGFGQLFVAAG